LPVAVDQGFVVFARKLAILNAVKHNGKAQIGPVIGTILGERPEFRTNIKEISALINDIIREVNNLSVEEQKRIALTSWPEMLAKTKTEVEKTLPPLPNVNKYPKVVTRYAPNPDCVLHLGSARAIILCSEYARMHIGEFILRLEDTDPRVKRPVLEFYDKIQEDLIWLKCKPDTVYIQSDRIPIYYKYAEKLLKGGYAYVCLCESETFRKLSLAEKPCKCRDLSPEENMDHWGKMLAGEYWEGEAVVRVKTDLKHPNPAVRDWPAMRIIDTVKYPHPRVGSKYLVWPLYNLASGVDDHLMGITHIIRGKEHLTNQVRQEYMYSHLGWKYPETIHYGRLKITGATLSKSKIVQGMKEGLYKSWDDPRLATFAALRRRGITAEAITRMIIDIGPKTADVTLSWENLYAYNRKGLDSIANRYFFVSKPIEFTVRNIPRTYSAKLHLHPEQPEKGFREHIIAPKEGIVQFWISSKDVDASRMGSFIRLMELFNVRIESASIYAAEASYVNDSYEEAKRMKAPLIHWIPICQDMACRVIMPDASPIEGVSEDACKNLKPNDIVQFERFGFVRVDKANKELVVYYAHK